jgi:hypothetical protein
MEFDPFSGSGLDTLELVWEPCISKSPTRQMSFKLPLAVVVVDRNNAVAKAIIETNGSLGAVVGPPL